MLQPRFFSPLADGGNSSSQALPLAQSERVSIIDAIRGIALLGILLMNIPFMGLPYQLDFNISLRHELSGPNYYTWWIVNGLFEGTMRGLFSLLFGAGSILLLRRLEKKAMPDLLTPADIYYRRMIWLLIFGLIDAFLFIWIGDILYSYALCGLFLYPCRNMKPKHLLWLALLMCVLSATRQSYSRYQNIRMKEKGVYAQQLERKQVKLTDEQKEQKEKWEKYQRNNHPDSLRKAADKQIGKVLKANYFQLISLSAEENVHQQTMTFYLVLIWDVLGFFFLGMALFKWGVLTGERSLSFYWGITIVGFAVGLSINYYILKVILEAKFDWMAVAERMPVDLYQLKRLFMTFGHLGAIMLLYKYKLAKGFLSLMAGVGQMAFTNYLLQGIIGGIIFNGYGFGWYGQLQRYQIYYVAGGIWLFQIIFSRIWLHYFLFGPFEWAWRSLTYWKVQPFRRKG